MSKKEIFNIVLIFLAWKLAIFAFANISQILFPLQTNFLGGGLLNYLRHPLFWGFINFDGEHYLSIAQNGYLPLTYFYFPLFPVVIKIITLLLGGSFGIIAASGLFLSNIFLIVAIVGLYKLTKLIYDQKSGVYTVILLLAFPTSFFLGAFYNESLFLATVTWSFYFAFTKRWLFAFLLCGLATATRLVGIALIPAISYEYYLSHKESFINIKTFLYTTISASGIILYIIYLKVLTGDYLAFFHNVEIFGNQRSTKLIILPQVFYRYIFKVLPAVNYSYIPQVFTVTLEIGSAILFLVGAYFVFVKMRRSVIIYYVLSYIIPTLSGSFSSFPRYALGLFPAFIVLASYLSKKSSYFRISVFAILLLCSLIAVSLFMRGYFVA